MADMIAPRRETAYEWHRAIAGDDSAYLRLARQSVELSAAGMWSRYEGLLRAELCARMAAASGDAESLFGLAVVFMLQAEHARADGFPMVEAVMGGHALAQFEIAADAGCEEAARRIGEFASALPAASLGLARDLMMPEAVELRAEYDAILAKAARGDVEALHTVMDETMTSDRSTIERLILAEQAGMIGFVLNDASLVRRLAAALLNRGDYDRAAGNLGLARVRYADAASIVADLAVSGDDEAKATASNVTAAIEPAAAQMAARMNPQVLAYLPDGGNC